MVRYVWLVLLVGWLLPIQAEDQEVTVTNVTVWVKVTDKSAKPVTGLTQSDFEIFEDGERVNPSCFEEVTLGGRVENNVSEPQKIDSGAPQVPRKQIVFLMDLATTSQNEFLHLKKKAAEFMKELSQNWDITLVSLIPGAMVVEVQSSKDPLVIQVALDKMTASQLRDIDTLNRRRELTTAIRLGENWPKKQQRQQIISEICGLARDFALKEKDVSLQWMDSLRQFDGYIKQQPPEIHKVVLFFSGGISSNPGRQYFEMIRNSNLMKEQTSDEMEVLRLFPECQDEGGYDLQKDYKKLVGQLNRYSITFYAVSSRGPINDLLETIRESDRKYDRSDLDFLKEYQDFLALIAEETGGVYFGNSLNFKKGFDAILSDLNHQYLLCYKPPEHKKLGAHSIKVKTKRSGVKLRHRSGYFDSSNVSRERGMWRCWR